jgi:hypothetical protein
MAAANDYDRDISVLTARDSEFYIWLLKTFSKYLTVKADGDNISAKLYGDIHGNNPKVVWKNCKHVIPPALHLLLSANIFTVLKNGVPIEIWIDCIDEAFLLIGDVRETIVDVSLTPFEDHFEVQINDHRFAFRERTKDDSKKRIEELIAEYETLARVDKPIKDGIEAVNEVLKSSRYATYCEDSARVNAQLMKNIVLTSLSIQGDEVIAKTTKRIYDNYTVEWSIRKIKSVSKGESAMEIYVEGGKYKLAGFKRF